MVPLSPDEVVWLTRGCFLLFECSVLVGIFLIYWKRESLISLQRREREVGTVNQQSQLSTLHRGVGGYKSS